MQFKVNENGYSAIVKNHVYCGLTNYKWKGIEVNSGDIITIWSNLERQIRYKGSSGIIRKVYYKRFWHYELCYVSVYISNFNKTIWLEADCLDFSEVHHALRT